MGSQQQGEETPLRSQEAAFPPAPAPHSERQACIAQSLAHRWTSKNWLPWWKRPKSPALKEAALTAPAPLQVQPPTLPTSPLPEVPCPEHKAHLFAMDSEKKRAEPTLQTRNCRPLVTT